MAKKLYTGHPCLSLQLLLGMPVGQILIIIYRSQIFPVVGSQTVIIINFSISRLHKYLDIKSYII